MRRLLSSVAVLVVVGGTAVAAPAHPLGNFSISQYTAIRVGRDAVELRYLVDMAEIPTFQEIQETGIVPEAGHPGLAPYLARKAETLKDGLRLQIDEQPLQLRVASRDVIFPPGAGGLPTMKLGFVYRASLPPGDRARLHYRDGNYPDRAGWKEIIAVAGPGATIASASVPERDRSGELSDYPTDLLNSPPQDREARLVFARQTAPPMSVRTPGPAPGAVVPPRAQASRPPTGEPPSVPPAPPPAEPSDLRLRANRQATTPRSALAELVTLNELGLGVVVFALAAAAALGAFHALEPGHGKTVVAAYLVGSRGTVRHAVLLGLTVTASHTAGVYLLGGIALYASRYVVPERLYPWLGVFSGLVIAALGFSLVLRRYAAAGGAHAHGHGHGHHADHHHDHAADGHDHHHHHHHDHAHHHGDGPVSLPALVALGVTGGIVPCPAAVVVLLSALSLNRVGFGLLLIVAFSVGLAAVLITIGVLMVYARRVMARFSADGSLVGRWLPLASSAVITVVGVVITVQSLVAAGILHIKL